MAERKKLTQIASTAWEHPADRAALNALRSIPGFDQVVRKVAAFFGEKGTWIALFPREALAADANVSPQGTGFGGVTLAHNVGSKALVDAVMAEAAAAGATIVKPAQDVFWGGYNGYFADPDGFLWEIAWNPHFEVG